jgi:chlorobactene glucosyltransferase
MIIEIGLYIFCVITLWNLFWLSSKRNDYQPNTLAVIIPTRNEGQRIGDLLKSLKNQTLLPKKIIVCDDNSTDNTSEVVKNYQQNNPLIDLVSVPSLPPDWAGKCWACYNGYLHLLKVQPDVQKIVFLDADIRLQPKALERITQNSKPFLSYFPSQKYTSSDIALTPLANWLILTILPIQLAETINNRYLIAANGQCLVFTKECYETIGTHKAVRYSFLEDLDLAKLVTQHGYPLALEFGNLVECRMYPNLLSAIKGFSKNLIFTHHRLQAFILLIAIVSLSIIFLNPELWWLILGQRILVSWFVKQTWWEILLHPIQILMLVLTAIVSFTTRLFKLVFWKDRVYKTSEVSFDETFESVYQES